VITYIVYQSKTGRRTASITRVNAREWVIARMEEGVSLGQQVRKSLTSAQSYCRIWVEE
jgi:hypothetical protein